MSAGTHSRPVRLELNNTGAWKVLGRWDASNDEQTALVLEHADSLVRSLHNSEDPKQCATLRVSTANGLAIVLMRWDLEGGWRDAKTGEPV